MAEEMIERFHDDDQITQWQQRAFPRNQPQKNCRERDGVLQRQPSGEGEPVFFLREDGRLTFFGRAQMFRLPYQNGPRDLIPPELRRTEDIDYADAIFGYTKGREVDPSARAYAGRVSVTDATLVEGQTDLRLSDRPIVPRILSTPKPTAFQHYLVQTSDNKAGLKYYGSAPLRETVIRGHKVYWRQGPQTADQIQDPAVKADSTQHTRMSPLRSGLAFTFRVHFENLSDQELGALCWVLHPLGDERQDYCHTLGMGKPLGMGAVKLEATLYRSDRAARYRSLFDGDAWQTGVMAPGEKLSGRATLERLIEPFERHVLVSLGRSDDLRHLYELERIGMLLKLLEWPGFPADDSGDRTLADRPNTRSMAVDEFRERPVLPDPSAFGALAGDARPAAASALRASDGATVSDAAPAREERPGTPSMAGTARPASPATSPRSTVGRTPPPGEERANRREHPTPPPGGETGRAMTQREVVTLVKQAKIDRWQVRTHDGAEISCAGIPSVGHRAGRECHAAVTREGGRAVRALFKGWKQ